MLLGVCLDSHVMGRGGRSEGRGEAVGGAGEVHVGTSRLRHEHEMKGVISLAWHEALTPDRWSDGVNTEGQEAEDREAGSQSDGRTARKGTSQHGPGAHMVSTLGISCTPTAVEKSRGGLRAGTRFSHQAVAG